MSLSDLRDLLPLSPNSVQITLILSKPFRGFAGDVALSISHTITGPVRYLNLLLAMSTPSNNERSPRKWFKQKFRSVFSARSPSRSRLDVPDALPTSTDIPPINPSFLTAQAKENSPSYEPRITADRKGSGE